MRCRQAILALFVLPLACASPQNLEPARVSVELLRGFSPQETATSLQSAPVVVLLDATTSMREESRHKTSLRLALRDGKRRLEAVSVGLSRGSSEERGRARAAARRDPPAAAARRSVSGQGARQRARRVGAFRCFAGEPRGRVHRRRRRVRRGCLRSGRQADRGRCTAGHRRHRGEPCPSVFARTFGARGKRPALRERGSIDPLPDRARGARADVGGLQQRRRSARRGSARARHRGGRARSAAARRRVLRGGASARAPDSRLPGPRSGAASLALDALGRRRAGRILRSRRAGGP
jgi:hypothetical protein